MKKNKKLFLSRNYQIIYAVILIILIPLTIIINTIWSVKSFQKNIDVELQRQALSIGKMFNTTVYQETVDLQNKVKDIGNSNQDIHFLEVLIPEGNDFKTIASLNEDNLNNIVEDLNYVIAWHENQAIGTLVLEVEDSKQRYWEIVLPLSNKQGEKEALLSLRMSLTVMDDLVKDTLTKSYIILSITIIIVILLLTLNTRLFEYAILFRKLKEVDKMKDEFISMASHELRTPITTLKGFLSMMKEDNYNNLDDQGKKNLKIMEVSTNRLNSLVEDLLNVSRIEQGRLQVKLEEVNTKDILKNTADEFSLIIEKKGLELKLKLEEELSNNLADQDRLKQILVNLMGNAIKYTKKGQIELTAKKDKDNIIISIKDSGIGISAKDREGLFTKFHRVKNEETKGITGTGLGLWITKQLVELMNGEIYVDSIEHVGTQVSFTIPIFKK